MAWSSGWVLVPPDRVGHIARDRHDWLAYPCVSFPDGEVEGSDLNRLWWIVAGLPEGSEPMWGQFYQEGLGECRKVARVRQPVLEAFVALTDERVREVAALWQQAESPTSSLRWWALPAIARAILEMGFLAQTPLRGSQWQVLMVWHL